LSGNSGNQRHCAITRTALIVWSLLIIAGVIGASIGLSLAFPQKEIENAALKKN
jgi:hypothetical protein